MHRATFIHGLHQQWEPDHTPAKLRELAGPTGDTDPNHSPMTMGMFATTKQWWTTIGGMDDGLETWGGENIEVSLRTWMCGGDILVGRGAVVYHAFRTAFPYAVSGVAMQRNLVRVAEAWIDDDESRAEFYKAIHVVPGSIDVGNLDAIRLLQKRLQCKNWKWYLSKFPGRVFLDRMPYDTTPAPKATPAAATTATPALIRSAAAVATRSVSSVPRTTPAVATTGVPSAPRVTAAAAPVRVRRAPTHGTIAPLPETDPYFLSNPEGPLPDVSPDAPFSLVVGAPCHGPRLNRISFSV